MTETARLLELNLEIEGMLRILDSRQSAQARSRLSVCFDDFVKAMNQYLASEDDGPVPEVPEEKVEQVSESPAEPVAAYFELDVPDVRQNLAEIFTDADRERFCKGLFDSNYDDFDDTICLLSDMESYSEAEDYLLNDMMWNRSEQIVSDFLEVLSQNMPK